MLRRLLWCPLLGVLAIAGCSSTEPTPEPPDIQGQYTGGWTFTATRPDGTVDFGPATCPCAFAVTRQQGFLFSGMTTLQAPCGGEIPITGGRIEADGRIQFDVNVNLLGAACAIVTQPAMTGTFSGGTITVQRTEQYDCTTAGGFRETLTVRTTLTRI